MERNKKLHFAELTSDKRISSQITQHSKKYTKKNHLKKRECELVACFSCFFPVQYLFERH